MRRQVRFTPFPTEPVGWMIEQAGAELFLFSSDYPHPEGGRDPLAPLRAQPRGDVGGRQGTLLLGQLRRDDVPVLIYANLSRSLRTPRQWPGSVPAMDGGSTSPLDLWIVDWPQ